MPGFVENRRVKGGHGAGVSEQLWDDIARYILNQALPQDASARHTWWIWLLGGFPPVVWAGLLGIVIWVASRITQASPNSPAEGLALAAFILAVLFVLRRV